MKAPAEIPVMPHHEPAEKAVLAAIILNPDLALEAYRQLKPEQFFLRPNRLIFAAAQRVSAKGGTPTLMTLADELDAKGELDAAGGPAYLASLIDGVPSINSEFPYAVERIRDDARKRAGLYFAEDFTKKILEPGSDPRAVCESAIGQMLAIAGDSEAAPVARAWNDVAHSAIHELEAEWDNPGLAARMRFGLDDIDEVTGGLRRKEMALIVAPTSNGKTLLAEQLATRADADGFKVLFFSAEMPAEELLKRELAWRARMPFYFVRRPEKLSGDELDRLRKAAEQPCGVRIVDRDITPERIWAMAEAVKRSSGLDLLIVDYDQLVIEAGIKTDSDDDSIFRHQRNFIFAAKRIAQRLDVCFVLLSQLRKVSPKIEAGQTPRLDDIWGDSSIRNTPHLILWLRRLFFPKMDKRDERKAKVYVLKSRSGRTPAIDLEFDPEYVRFLDAPPTEADSTVEERVRL